MGEVSCVRFVWTRPIKARQCYPRPETQIKHKKQRRKVLQEKESKEKLKYTENHKQNERTNQQRNERMANLCALLLPVFLLFSVSSPRVSSSSPSQDDGFSSVIGQAERFIRGLNLVPKFANTLSRYRSDVSSSSSPRSALVEERIRLYVEGESESSISREELGHHAGYFNLPNTHDSRFNLMSLHVFLWITS